MAKFREQWTYKYPIVVHDRAKIGNQDLFRVEVLSHYKPAIHCAEGGDIEDDADELEFKRRDPAVKTSAEFFSKDLGTSLQPPACLDRQIAEAEVNGKWWKSKTKPIKRVEKCTNPNHKCPKCAQ
uniref:Uncharacterized protein n=1 Tax=Tetranychus urticae TaxID=32264 RepID=T1KIJ7_TETUR